MSSSHGWFRNTSICAPKGSFGCWTCCAQIYARRCRLLGHFGREEPEFTWERTDKAAALRGSRDLII
jgi:S-adenosylmethionine synthetase